MLEVLELLQLWSADERFADSKLAVITGGAVAVGRSEGVLDLASSAMWGLVCSAQAENPGRFVLLDIDGEQSSMEALPAALRCGEDRVALRAGTVWIPRLVRSSARGGRLSAPLASSEWCLGGGGRQFGWFVVGRG